MGSRVIIAVCGDSGAGKSTTTEILCDFGFRSYSLSGLLRAEAEAAFGQPARAQVQGHGRDMQAQHGNDYYARKLVAETTLLDEELAVIDGMRNLDEMAYLRDAAAARGITVVLLALVLDAEHRFARVQGRARTGDPADIQKFAEDDARSNGAAGAFQNNELLIRSADRRIENTGDLETLRAALRDVAQEAREIEAQA